MTNPPPFDLQSAHRYFSVECFNRAWDYIDKASRTPEEDEEMLRLSLASLWHWTQRADCSPVQCSVGNWQVARVYALLGQADNARRYAQRCRQVSQDDSLAPFYLAYAYEALARAEMAAGEREAMNGYLEQARLLAERMRDPEARQMLLRDLESIRC